MKKLALVLSLIFCLPAPPALSNDGDTKALTVPARHQPLLADKTSAPFTTTIQGRSIRYRVTVGAIKVHDDERNIVGEVAYTAFIAEGSPERARPVTFAMNGGPGAASVFLQLGAMGPKRVQFGASGESASGAPQLIENQASWLNFTDLVFIDPIGTGYSRPFVEFKKAAELFWNDEKDPRYLSRVVFDWLKEKGRLLSPVYLVGESHSGYRVPKMVRLLQSEIGLPVKGMVLVSPILNTGQHFQSDISPLPWMSALPSMAAARLDQLGQLNDETMQPVMDYARGDYLVDLMKGYSDPGALDRIVERVSEFTGLNPDFVRKSGGRIDPSEYVRQLYRKDGGVGFIADPTVSMADPFPFAPQLTFWDTMDVSTISVLTAAITAYYVRELGWRVNAPYQAINIEANAAWNDGKWRQFESFSDIRNAVAADSRTKVLIAHGWSDLSCPFMASELLIESLPKAIEDKQVQIVKYPGGHMFYNRIESLNAFHDDAAAFYGGH